MLTSQHFKIFWNENNYGFPRLAVRAPKKEIPGAVFRNSIKRLVREGFRIRLETLPSFDYLVVCRRHLGICSNKEIMASFSTLLIKISPCGNKKS